MKKLCSLLLCLTLLALIGCGAGENNTSADHEGIVVYVNTEFGSLMIWENDPLQGEGYARFTVDHAEDFKVGDRIRFAMTGEVMETYPRIYSEVENVRVIK